MLCPQVSCFEEYYEHLINNGSVNLEVSSRNHLITKWLIFLGRARDTQFHVPDLPAGPFRWLAIDPEVYESGYNYNVMCYHTSYIQKAAFIQNILKAVVETAMKASTEGLGGDLLTQGVWSRNKSHAIQTGVH